MDRKVVIAAIAVVIAAIFGVLLLNGPRALPPAASNSPAPATIQNPTLAASVPHGSFDSQTPPPPPDYAQDASWAALPERADFADRVPAGNSIPDGQALADVDVFYIQPTTFRSDRGWVQDIADAKTNAWTDVSVTSRQAGIFNGCCKIYAPRYRQAAFGDPKDPVSRAKALAFAYEDVKRAFAYYIEHYNNGRPFILVGHSQGTFHLLPLLEEAVDQSALKDRLVAAYAIGIAVPVGTFGRTFKNITLCAKPDQTGCVVSWNTYGPKGNAGPGNAQAGQRYAQRFQTEDGKDILCINPLTFDLSRPDAPRSANLGALPGPSIDAPLPAVKPGLVGATCKADGGLYADIPTDPDFVLTIFPGDVLHMHDMDLFYQNIRANAVLRTKAWAKVHVPG